MPVVNKFLEVFPNELTRIPPDREIEFGMDVMLGTQPISIDVDAEAPTLESVPVVNEFLEVFPNELPGISPDMEIDFGVDLMCQKAVKFQWSDVCERRFQEPKSKLTTALVLTLPEGTYGVHVDIFMYHKGLQYNFKLKELNLRKIKWMELLKDYDLDILYHPEKANVVADALSRKSMDSLAYLEAHQRSFAKEVHRLASLGVRLADSGEVWVIMQNRVE
ncbi:uncharacterized protein [Nicotiana tomentosiformis]|uniref:uncharacterized protein n=1 Tax=Nicotiana tomentosiformis TaxID=4098 RepID=UPI00388C5C60